MQPAGVDGAVHLELQRQLRGVLREAGSVLLQVRGFARLLAQQDLVVDQVEEAVEVVAQCRVPLQVVLGRDVLALLPAPALVFLEQTDEVWHELRSRSRSRDGRR
jgi:hypothetical protein